MIDTMVKILETVDRIKMYRALDDGLYYAEYYYTDKNDSMVFNHKSSTSLDAVLTSVAMEIKEEAK